jgi:hypothetical protein
MNTRIVWLAPVFVLSSLLAACAGPGVGRSDGNVVVEAASNGQALPGAQCTVSNGAGRWNVMTPSSAPVGSPAGDLRIICNKPGFRTSEVVYRPSGGVTPNVGVGVGGGSGHVGLGLGLGIPVFGSIGEGYPSRVVVEMNPQ